MAENKEIIEIQLNIKRTGEAIDAETKKLLGLTHGTDVYNKSLEKTGRLRRQQAAEVRVQTDLIAKANGAVRTGAGQANQAVTELGRGISDLPYGIQGVANNFSQLVDIIGSISQKEGGLKKAFSSITSSLIGPLGIVLAIQAAVAALQFFIATQDDVEEETVEFDKALRIQVDTLREYAKAVDGSTTSLQRRADLLAIIKDLDEDYAEDYSNLSEDPAKQEELTRVYREKKNAIEEHNLAMEEYKKNSLLAEAAEKDLKDEQIKNKKSIEELTKERDKFTEGTRVRYSFTKQINSLNRRNTEIEQKLTLILGGRISLERDLTDAIKNKAEATVNYNDIAGNSEIELGTVEWYQDQISSLKAIRDSLSKTSKEYENYGVTIAVLEKKLADITGGDKDKTGGSDKVDPLVAATRKAELAAAEDFYAKLELNRRYDIEDIKETNAEKIALIKEQINKEYDARRDTRRQKDSDKSSAALTKEAAKAEKARLSDIKKFTKTANDYRIQSDDDYALQVLDAEEQRQLTALEGVANSEQKQNEVTAYFRNEREKIFKESSDEIVKTAEAEAAARLAAQVALGNGLAASFGAISQLFEEGTAASKAFALAEIATGTAVGFIQALDIAQKSAKGTGTAAAFAFPIFYASQIAAVLGAASQAKNILEGGSSSASSTSVTAPTTNVPDYNIVGTTQATTSDGQPVGASGESGDDYIIKTYITSTDVSSRLALDRKVEQSSAL